MIKIDQNSYRKDLEEQIFYANDTVGDCMVGVKGMLYPVMQLKSELLNLKSSWWTMTLDMCRDRRGGIQQKVLIEYVNSLGYFREPCQIRKKLDTVVLKGNNVKKKSQGF